MEDRDDIVSGTPMAPDERAGVPEARTSPVRGSLSNVQASLETGDFLSASGSHHQALMTYLELWSSPLYRQDIGLLRRIAYCQERLGRYPEVIHLLAPIFANDANGRGLPGLELSDSAGPFSDSELRTAPERIEEGRCRLVLGKSYLESGRMAEAEVEGRRAQELLRQSDLPEVGFAENLLGAVLFRRGEVDQANGHFRRALEHFRRHGDVTNMALSFVNLGAGYKRRCEWRRALEYYQAAYYLRATEGDLKDQGGILQNLSLVLLRLGRYEEAAEKLEESLHLAQGQDEPARVLRARIALARLARESWDFSSARAHLASCRQGSMDPVPQREGCLLLIEKVILARLEGHRPDALQAAAELREQIERSPSHADLRIDADCLDAWLELDQGQFGPAEAGFRSALDLAQRDHNLDQENHVLLGQMELAEKSGHPDEADRIFLRLEERFRRSGEQPSLARLYECRGAHELDSRHHAEAALGWFSKARELWRRMSRQRLEAMAGLRAAETLSRLDRHSEAGSLLRALRERPGGDLLALPIAAPLVERLEARVRQAEERPAGAVLDGVQALERLDEILRSAEGPGEKLRGLQTVLVEALQADGALLARVHDGSLEVVSTVSMGRLQGKRLLASSQLGLFDLTRPSVLTPDAPKNDSRGELRAEPRSDSKGEPRIEAKPESRPESRGGETLPHTALCLPVLLFGRTHLVYLERREHSPWPYTRSDLDYAMVLLAQAARGLRPLIVGEAIEAEVERVGRAIWLADVVTQNSRMLSILELVRKVGDSDLTVLLQGETGTGKKLLAQAIHRTSSRRNLPFVTVDCAALPDSLLESELFGHRKGAFTGAVQDRIGLLEEANGGTIFLDEIDKAGLTVQRRFLHVLDTGEVRPVGSSGYRHLDVRVVCATSCSDLRQEVKEGRFLKDLYYRLNDISIQVPALRERPDDIPLLAEWFLERQAAEMGREIGGVAPALHAALAAHSWPGNIRELEKAIRRVVVLAENAAVVGVDLLPAAVQESYGAREKSPGNTLRDRLEAFERILLLEVLERTGWNRTRAAAELGLSRKGLKNKIQRYTLDRRRSRRP